jgi:hypothetical protein
LFDVCGGEAFGVESDVGVLFMEGGEGLREEVRGEDVGDADAEGAGLEGGEVGDGGFGAFEVGEGGGGVGAVGVAGGGEANRAADAVEEGDAEGFFEAADGEGERGLGDVEGAGGAGEVEGTGGGEEGVEVGEGGFEGGGGHCFSQWVGCVLLIGTMDGRVVK